MTSSLQAWARLCALMVIAIGPLAGGQQLPQASRPTPAPVERFPDPNELVRFTVERELQEAGDDSHLYRYVLSRESTSGVLVRDLVETRGLIVARTLAWNGRPLTPEERRKDDERLAKLRHSEEEQRQKLEDQQAEQERVTRLLAALPKALLYSYDGHEVLQGRDTIRLSFIPKPGFSAYKETYLYKAAYGYLWIDAEAFRLRRLVATLKNDVNIGWGIFGHIDKGSHLEVEAHMVPGGQWRIDRLIMEGTGRAFIFKSIKLHTIQHAYNFTPVPPMTLGAAIQLLQEQPLAVAEQR